MKAKTADRPASVILESHPGDNETDNGDNAPSSRRVAELTAPFASWISRWSVGCGSCLVPEPEVKAGSKKSDRTVFWHRRALQMSSKLSWYHRLSESCEHYSGTKTAECTVLPPSNRSVSRRQSCQSSSGVARALPGARSPREDAWAGAPPPRSPGLRRAPRKARSRSDSSPGREERAHSASAHQGKPSRLPVASPK